MIARKLTARGKLSGKEARDLRTGRHYTLTDSPNAMVATLVGVGPGNQLAWEESSVENDKIDLALDTIP